VLHYARHNNDIIVDVKTFWHPFFAVFMTEKTNCTQKLLIYFKVTRTTRTEPILLWMAATGTYENSCLL